jgi:hypothetical protein
MNAPLVELVERVTSAEEGSRDLDLAMWNLVSREEQPWRFTRFGSITCDRYGPNALGNPVVSLNEFTTSLEYAIELLEFAMPGASWGIRTAMEGGFAADVPFVKLKDMHPTRVCHRTAPLAICLALLRALSSQEASK